MHRSSAKNLNRTQSAFPDKLFYKIGDVSRLAGVESYVLRYWESEFPFLRPRKSKSGQRVYVRKDLELILQIKNLLYDERYTIEGVRKKIGTGEAANPAEHRAVNLSKEAILEGIRKRLRDILNRNH